MRRSVRRPGKGVSRHAPRIAAFARAVEDVRAWEAWPEAEQVRANLAERSASASPPRRARAGRDAGDGRAVSPRSSTSPAESSARWPRPASRWSGRTARRTWRPRRRGARRASPGTSSATCRAARSSRSLPHVRLIHSVASDSALAQLDARTGAEHRGARGGQRRRRGVARAASRPASSRGFVERCPVTVGGPDDDAAARPSDPEDSRPLVRRAARAGRRAGPARACRWAPARTSRSRSRRARRSCASAACCT